MVARGVWGRALIAIEPLICALIFVALAVGMAVWQHGEAVWIFAPIFTLAALAFVAYAVVVLVAPIRALIQTFAPIYIVDGYVRYRRRDLNSDPHSNGYIAVLNEDRRQLCEWPLYGSRLVTDLTSPGDAWSSPISAASTASTDARPASSPTISSRLGIVLLQAGSDGPPAPQPLV